MTDSIQVAPKGHIPALDGVGGLAILLVLMFHFTDWSDGASQWLRAGWIGVDLFFVLSGFLITRILLETRDSANYFRSFYARRSLRIFPLYFGVLVAIFIVGPWVGLDQLPGYTELAEKQGWFWTYSPNIYVSITGRFDLHASWLDLTHFWSLAVEEHFYLIWPAAVLLLSHRGLVKLCLICMILAPISRILMIVIWSRPLGPYFLTFCRIDSLAVGGLMAVLTRQAQGLADAKRKAQVMAIVGTLAMVLLGLRTGRIAAADRLIQMIGFSALGIAFAGMIVLVSITERGRFWSRVWTNPLLGTLGRYSYGIYVYHQLFGRKLATLIAPHLQWAGSLGASLLTIGVGLLVTLAVAMASYHLLEAPFLRLKSRFTPVRPSHPVEISPQWSASVVRA